MSNQKKISFWKGNRLSGHFQLTIQEIVEKFVKSEAYKDWKAGESYNLARTINLWIIDKQGLGSVFDKKDWPAIENAIRKEVLS